MINEELVRRIVREEIRAAFEMLGTEANTRGDQLQAMGARFAVSEIGLRNISTIVNRTIRNLAEPVLVEPPCTCSHGAGDHLATTGCVARVYLKSGDPLWPANSTACRCMSETGVKTETACRICTHPRVEHGVAGCNVNDGTVYCSCTSAMGGRS